MGEHRTINYAGLTLPDVEEGEVPVAAVVLLKVITAEGTVSYRECKSADLHYMEALGMATTFTDTCRQSLLRSSRPR